MIWLRRGHRVVFPDPYYEDTGEPVTPERPCIACDQPATPQGYDACLGELPGVRNACCGHGVEKHAYVQLDDGTILRGANALAEFERLKKGDSCTL